MVIHSKKSFLFTNGDEIKKVNNLEITEVPDWVAKTPLFKLATEGNNPDITVITNSEEKVKAENGDLNKASSTKSK